MNNDFPQTLVEAIRHFADPQVTFDFLVKLRWPSGKVSCPRCQSENVSFISTRKIWKCKCCQEKSQFSVRVGTIFEDSALPLDKWLVAIWLIANAKNGVSSYEIHRALGVTQKTGWFMLQRIRLAMQHESDDRNEDKSMTKKPEKTPFQKFQALAQNLIRVPKSELDKKLRDHRSKNKSNANKPKHQ